MIKWGDTLLAHHAFASHLPQRLDWVVSTYLESEPWKVTHGRRGGGGSAAEKGHGVENLSAEDLCLYNAQDCILTIKTWAAMQENLEAERGVYEHDLKLADVCRGMGRIGIGIDFDRKTELSRLLLDESKRLAAEMLVIVPGFSPSRPASVREAFRQLGAPQLRVTDSGLTAVDDETLERYIVLGGDVGRLAGLLSDWRAMGKCRSTYVGGADGVQLKYDEHVNPRTGRAHFNWKPFGTVSGRLSCRLQSCPKQNQNIPYMRAREIYVPRPGYRYVYFDVAAAEMKLAAYLSGDPNFIAATKGDIHANNAKLVFPEVAERGWLDGEAKKDPSRGKPFRDIGKGCGFAVGYGAGAEKVHSTLVKNGLHHVTLRQIQAVLKKLREAYRIYFGWADGNVARVRETGYMRTPFLGRIRWFGPHASPTEVYNYPMQSACADIMNERTIRLVEELAPYGIDLVAQVHDADTFECPISEVSRCKDIVRRVWDEPLELPGGKLTLGIDLKEGERWSDL